MQDLKQRNVLNQNNQQTTSSQQKNQLYSSTYPHDHPLAKFRQCVSTDFLGGPKIFQLNHIINTFKGSTGIFLILLMCYYNNFSLSAYLIFILHGSYGFIWIAKDLLFPDKSWQVKQTIFSSLVACAILLSYWSIGWFIISRRAITNPSLERIAVSCFCYIFGVTLMVVSDVQKFITLKYKQGLITDGLFSRCRNPNYLGEIILYGGFAIVGGAWENYALLLFIWTTLFNLNIYLKELSFSKKEGWEQYKNKSYLLLFKFFDEDIHNYLFYGGLAAFITINYSYGGLINVLKQQ
ncbi:steroid 5-alpha c-terminal domain protein [Ichthyophthirius multifiliis]|uniref:Steroid 5-alpha c-terminal domain protein n=1 Tax=Ichthyophthirius multifiliis TaxID=5932 RepID=G0QIR2_ICHMU|nr:steroid 5-alpha c-terminal domain protein [Ichthyophthirius multifiliis]EGR34892.1 steroid 5-alpha c-terminal domain protein [Ichthyophthirius multifiliis]|eukprot:XP_004040196.1 steroid 5-alpha c-terminal domain protein [Ichthyophthirius multifiliis]